MSARLSLALVLAISLVGCKKKPPAAAGAASGAETTDAAGAEAANAEDSPAEGRLGTAIKQLQSGRETDTLKARGTLDKLVVDEPSNALAWYNLGVARHRLSAVVEAAEAFAKVTTLEPSNMAAWLALGQVEVELGDADLALRHLDKALAISGDNLDLRIARASALRALGRPVEAVTEAKEALRLNAKSLPAYTQMGLAHLEQKRPELARFVFEKAETVEGAESDASLQANFGWALYQAGERYAAETRLKRAVELDPNFVPGLVYLARLYLDDRNASDALPLLENARSKAPRNHGLLVDLGVALRGVGRPDEAKVVWESALAMRPGDPVPLFDLGLLLADAYKDYDGAVAKLQAYVAQGGTQVDAATEYIDRIQKDKAAAERQRKRDDDRKKREAEKAERERVLKEAEKQKAASAPPEVKPEPEPSAPAPSPWSTGPQ